VYESLKLADQIFAVGLGTEFSKCKGDKLCPSITWKGISKM